ncbi:hypothetical protein HanIR_Chr14g0698981 [Helianthus annuus]|nr:hypothetical protein HanIR_Chr14g0698981 [Helianthus annuus]
MVKYKIHSHQSISCNICSNYQTTNTDLTYLQKTLSIKVAFTIQKSFDPFDIKHNRKRIEGIEVCSSQARHS